MFVVQLPLVRHGLPTGQFGLQTGIVVLVVVVLEVVVVLVVLVVVDVVVVLVMLVVVVVVEVVVVVAMVLVVVVVVLVLEVVVVLDVDVVLVVLEVVVDVLLVVLEVVLVELVVVVVVTGTVVVVVTTQVPWVAGFLCEYCLTPELAILPSSGANRMLYESPPLISSSTHPSVPGLGGRTVSGTTLPLPLTLIRNAPADDLRMETPLIAPFSNFESLYLKPRTASPDQYGRPVAGLVPCGRLNV